MVPLKGRWDLVVDEEFDDVDAVELRWHFEGEIFREPNKFSNADAAV